MFLLQLLNQLLVYAVLRAYLLICQFYRALNVVSYSKMAIIHRHFHILNSSGDLLLIIDKRYFDTGILQNYRRTEYIRLSLDVRKNIKKGRLLTLPGIISLRTASPQNLSLVLKFMG